MAVERMVKRIVYVALCPSCGKEDLREDQAPKEKLCGCGKWVQFEQREVIATNLGLPGYR